LPPLPGPREGLLDGILSLVERAQHPIAMDQQLTSILDQVAPEGLSRIQQHLVTHCVRPAGATTRPAAARREHDRRMPPLHRRIQAPSSTVLSWAVEMLPPVKIKATR